MSDWPIPPEHLRFMGEDEASFVRIGDQLLQPLLGRLNRRGRVLDIGCGYGRLAYALRRAGFAGEYVGLDILPDHIRWLNETIAEEGYRFVHADLRNGRYNPNGRLALADYSLPAMSGPPDLVLMFSVFTHLAEADCRRYLELVGEAMDEHSTFYATWFLLNDEQRLQERGALSRFPMTHPVAEHSCTFSQVDPLHAIGHEESAVERWVAEAGLAVVARDYGVWCGRKGGGPFQDSLTLVRQTRGDARA